MNPFVEVVVTVALAEKFEVEMVAFVGMEALALVGKPCFDCCSTIDCLGYDQNFSGFT